MCKTINAVINRTMNIAERIGPSLRSSGAKLGFAKEIRAAIPAHCNESVSVTRTTAALASRTKIIGLPHRDRKCFVHEFVGDLYDNPNRPGRQALSSWRSLFLPASTEIPVNANQRQELIQLSLSESQLSIKIVGFVCQHLQVAGGAPSITRLRKPRRVLSGKCKLLLLLSELSVFAVLDERVRNSTKSLLDGLLIDQRCFLLPRLRELYIGANSSSGEDGLHQGSSETPQPSRA